MDGVEERIRLIDWRALGIELRRHGLMPNRIARELNLPPSTVISWFNKGYEPGYSNGVRVVQLYILTTGKRPPLHVDCSDSLISAIAQQ